MDSAVTTITTESADELVTTIGDSGLEDYLLVVHDDIVTNSMMLGFVALLLISGWLYGFFAHIFDQC